MMKKHGSPVIGEIILCKITKINPHSAFALLEEYNKEGMIHISEVSSGWVKDIRKYIKEGQTVTAKVMRIEGDHISLSLKRVDRKQKNEKIKDYRMNQKAQKMLGIAADKMNVSMSVAYEKVGRVLEDGFGSLYQGFVASLNNEQMLSDRGVPKEWISIITEVARKNIEQKIYSFRAKLIIRSYEHNGLTIIKNILKRAKGSGLDVKYISAPDYLIKFQSKNAKKCGKEFIDKLNKIKSMKESAEIDYEVM